MLPRTTRSLTLGAAAALTTVGLLMAGAPSAGATTQPTTVGLYASAYGSTAAVGPLTSGKTAYFSACSTVAGSSYGNQVAATDLGGVLGKVGAVVTKGSRTTDTVRVTSTTGATSLLGGLVRATALSSTSTATLTSTGPRTSGSTLVTGLTIAGVPTKVAAGVASRIDLPGIARITVNAQAVTSTRASTQLTVDALRIDVLQGNRLGLAAGSVVVASSTSGASRPTSYPASGLAYGTAVNVGTLAVAGASAYVAMPCGGTGGSVVKRGVAALAVPGLVKSSAITSTAQSVEAPGSTTSVLGSTVAGVDLLGGAVTADAITARSATTRTSAGLSRTDSGTVITNLKVLGRPTSLGTKPNTSVDVAGLGRLTLRKAVKQTNGLDVTGLELRLSADRLGVKAGTVIEVAVARSRVAAG